MIYTMEIIPNLGPGAWQPQYSSDTPKWYRNVFASSRESALRCTQSAFPGRPVRIIEGF